MDRLRLSRALVGYYSAMCTMGLGFILGPTLGSLAVQTGSTLAAISVVLAARSGGYIVGALLAGRVYDRFSGHPVLAAAVATLAIAMALIPGQISVIAIVTLAGVAGVGSGFTDVGTTTLTVRAYGDRVGPYMNGLHLAFGCGAFAGPLIVGQAISWTGGVAFAYWAVAILALPGAIWIALLPDTRIEESVVEKTASVTDMGLIALFMACFFFYVAAESSYGAWIHTYAMRLGLADPVAAAYLTSGFWGALTLGRLVGIALALRYRPRSMMSANLLGSVFFVSVALFSDSPVLLWISTLGTGFFMASSFPTLMSLAARRMRLSARASSWFFVSSSSGGLALPWLIGQFIEPFGARTAMIAILVALFFEALVFVGVIVRAPEPPQHR